jgi:hypothetical protein
MRYPAAEQALGRRHQRRLLALPPPIIARADEVIE